MVGGLRVGAQDDRKSVLFKERINMEQINNRELILFSLPEGNVSVNLIYQNDTLWLNQKLMAELFDKDSDTIGLHIKNIFSENELNEQRTTEVFSVVQTEGKHNVTQQMCA